MPMISVHVAFEINPTTLLVMLSVRAKNLRSVMVTPDKQLVDATPAEGMSGDCVMLYGRPYHITVASYRFRLVWREDITLEALKELAIREYHEASARAAQLRSRDRPDCFDDSEVNSWHITRLHTPMAAQFEEVEELRHFIGSGSFGEVFRTVDRTSGHLFVVKVISLRAYPSTDVARAAIHKEIKVLEKLKHENIIDYLGHADFHTDTPRIFMPLREGNLTSLARVHSAPGNFCSQVLEQMLSALDYLAYKQLCHRDVKPDNILFRNLGNDGFHFQLADFGLANYRQLATTFCGTGYYQAPELYPMYGTFDQTPKMDVWSLFATILATHPEFAFPPPDAQRYDDILRAVLAIAKPLPNLSAMAEPNPTRRASAAQMLLTHFEGRGLSTPRAQVPPLIAQQGPQQEQRPISNSQQQQFLELPLIIYPSRNRRRRLAAPASRTAGSSRPVASEQTARLLEVHSGVKKRTGPSTRVELRGKTKGTPVPDAARTRKGLVPCGRPRGSD